ncbi:MAG: molybdopterin-dependent oxidoreductase [Deltaproteobacteria bacterium]|nr:molybdopterin-dependent oxidoreductase [Deltaproteobacteria bacterium]
MSGFSAIGRRLPKLDGVAKALGRAAYLDDLRLPGLLHAKILRAAVPHGRIVHLDVSKAKRLTGVKEVLTATDLPEVRFGFARDNTALKKEKVRSIRDEVAAVAAVDESTAEEALGLIHIEYEQLPGVYDPVAALEPGAPLVHEGRDSNLYKEFRFQEGDVERALERAAAVVEGSFRLPLTSACPMGTSSMMAQADPSGGLTVWTPVQTPFLWQRDLALALRIPPSRVRVIQPTIGGGFGSRLDLNPFEPICALLSLRTGRPVKIVFDREEELLAAPSRQPCVIRLRSAAARDGTLLAREASLLLDCGAYVSWGALTPELMLQTTSSLYRLENVRFEAQVVYTNNPHTGAVRGWGNPQSTFAIESQMDELAEKLGIDPLEFRLRNANQRGDCTPQGFRITSCGLAQCLEDVKERSGWTRKRGRGIGVASAIAVSGGARVYRSDGCGSIVKVDDYGAVTLITGSTEIGQGSDVMLAQLVAEELGVRVEDVSVVNTDTTVKPWDTGTHASRTTFVAGNSARLAASKVRAELQRLASGLLGVAPERVALRDREAVALDPPGGRVPLERVVRARHFTEGGSILIAEHFYDPPTEVLDENLRGNWSAAYGFCAQVAEVQVDEETGKIEVERLYYAHDVGRAINPMMVEGQMEGAVSWGLGYALMEELKTAEGRVLNQNLHDYKLPTAADMPPVETSIVESVDPLGPFGAKGMGDFGLSATAPAIANAVYDAVGVRPTELPITPEKLRALLRRRDPAG